MRNSKQWWAETKADTAKLIDWLKKQYTGEVTAADRIVDMGKNFNRDSKVEVILSTIATQERIHAGWIGGLLESRGVVPQVGDANKRYWKETLPGIEDFETGAAVAAHAEKMRLERIEAIVDDADAPPDIRTVFQRILKDERWHEKAFRKLSTVEALEKTKKNHQAGMNSLGLVI